MDAIAREFLIDINYLLSFQQELQPEEEKKESDEAIQDLNLINSVSRTGEFIKKLEDAVTEKYEDPDSPFA